MTSKSLRIKWASSAVVFLCLGSMATAAAAAPVKNIVLVHGAWVDGSGWQPVYNILQKDGYHVSVVQEPLTSLQGDVAATRRVIDAQTGPVILVAHSYGGTVITEAGTDPHVVGLVYIAAHEPDAGETEASNGKRFPSATSKLHAIETTPDGFTSLNPVDFPADFAADLPAAQAQFEAHAQMPTAAQVFTTPVTNPAWKSKPSWALVAGNDKIINPDLERFYAARAHSHVITVPGASHSVYESQPQPVAALIHRSRRAKQRWPLRHRQSTRQKLHHPRGVFIACLVYSASPHPGTMPGQRPL
jgi:pimeloyl-ACP methyl ester carboxylesterase